MAGASAYLIWGVLPVYWKALGEVPALEQLAWRVAGSAVLAWLIVLLRKKPFPRSVFRPRVLGYLALASFLIAGNWGVFIWAISSGHIVEASLGYYMNPLVNVALGVVFLKERLGRLRLTAIVLALLAVIFLTVQAGSFPWVSVLLAVFFGFYGLIVKRLPAEIGSIEVLAMETVVLGPLAVAYLIVVSAEGSGHWLGSGTSVTVLLSLAGFVTLLPLWLFGIGAQRIPLGVLGFLQYTAPTMMLLLGVLVYGESFAVSRLAAFVLVAIALTLYTISLRRESTGNAAVLD